MSTTTETFATDVRRWGRRRLIRVRSSSARASWRCAASSRRRVAAKPAPQTAPGDPLDPRTYAPKSRCSSSCTRPACRSTRARRTAPGSSPIPEATLYKANGAPKAEGTHFLNFATGRPVWRFKDGSSVEAARKVTVPAGAANIPWLLLEAVVTTDRRRRRPADRTTWVQRLNTSGGVAPAAPCTPGESPGGRLHRRLLLLEGARRGRRGRLSVSSGRSGACPRTRPSDRSRRAVAAALEEEHVAPDAVQLPDPLAAADDAEADALVHAHAGRRSRGTRRSGSSRCPRPRSTRRARRAARGRRPGRAPPPRRRRCSRRRRRRRSDPRPARPRPSRRPGRPSTATKRCAARCAASQRSHDGTSVSNVASPVAMPSA